MKNKIATYLAIFNKPWTLKMFIFIRYVYLLIEKQTKSRIIRISASISAIGHYWIEVWGKMLNISYLSTLSSLEDRFLFFTEEFLTRQSNVRSKEYESQADQNHKHQLKDKYCQKSTIIQDNWLDMASHVFYIHRWTYKNIYVNEPVGPFSQLNYTFQYL